MDDFRRQPSAALIAEPPSETLPARRRCLLAASWFVAEVESLKASALVESPAYFRQRSVFGLDNFLVEELCARNWVGQLVDQ